MSIETWSFHKSKLGKKFPNSWTPYLFDFRVSSDWLWAEWWSGLGLCQSLTGMRARFWLVQFCKASCDWCVFGGTRRLSKLRLFERFGDKNHRRVQDRTFNKIVLYYADFIIFCNFAKFPLVEEAKNAPDNW